MHKLDMEVETPGAYPRPDHAHRSASTIELGPEIRSSVPEANHIETATNTPVKLHQTQIPPVPAIVVTSGFFAVFWKVACDPTG